MVTEVLGMVDDWADQTAAWFSNIPPRVAQVYRASGSRALQVPLLLHLLEHCNLPGLDELREDLTYGCQVLGTMRRGPGWLPRLDDKYSNPMNLPKQMLRTFPAVWEAFVLTLTGSRCWMNSWLRSTRVAFETLL